jgi:hypothetical protein
MDRSITHGRGCAARRGKGEVERVWRSRREEDQRTDPDGWSSVSHPQENAQTRDLEREREQATQKREAAAERPSRSIDRREFGRVASTID